MALCNLIDVGDVMASLMLLAEKLHKKCFTASILALKLRLFFRVLIEMNVNTCINNELNFSDVYRSVNYIWVTSKVYMNPLRFIQLARGPSVVFVTIELIKKIDSFFK